MTGRRPTAPEPDLPRLALTKTEAAMSLGVSVDFFDEHVLPELRIVRRGRAKQLGIDLNKDCTSGQGASAGGATAIFHYAPGIDAIVAGQKIHLAATFNATLPIILLGRDDFFALNEVSFDQRAQSFTLTEY